jgi:hypothetical protein
MNIFYIFSGGASFLQILYKREAFQKSLLLIQNIRQLLPLEINKTIQTQELSICRPTEILLVPVNQL